ncbi:MAG TPA: Stp1/IreP family PP2C-type Ser/Thr phosphatase [Acidobacteriaceae bacterium]|nr:Stp1/IreP family PP2C-type Ser/Thr phosphatase [Acidobacteriaceae bacterium]
MTPQTITLEAAALTHVGKVRTGNEDAYGQCLDAGVFAVCDGMGGAAAGEVASRIAVDTLIQRLCAVTTPEDRRQALEESIDAANRLVYAQASRDDALRGMGTTLVAVAIQSGHALIGHVGDSRCYLFRKGQLTRETNDHSLVDEQVRLGHMTQEDADRSPLRNVITRAIGTQRSVEAEIADLPLEPGDMLLLCTDGLTREVSEDRIARILRGSGAGTETVRDLCQQLIDAANAAGSHDNVTAILVRAA